MSSRFSEQHGAPCPPRSLPPPQPALQSPPMGSPLVLLSLRGAANAGAGATDRHRRHRRRRRRHRCAARHHRLMTPTSHIEQQQQQQVPLCSICCVDTVKAERADGFAFGSPPGRQTHRPTNPHVVCIDVVPPHTPSNNKNKSPMCATRRPTVAVCMSSGPGVDGRLCTRCASC